jgi:hypothetical protein
MPQGKGTYGSKVGRPPKKKMGGGMLQKKPVAMKKGGAVESSLRPKARPKKLEKELKIKAMKKIAAEKKKGREQMRQYEPDRYKAITAAEKKKFNSLFGTAASTDNKETLPKVGRSPKKMRDGGMCRGMGAATKGGGYKI